MEWLSDFDNLFPLEESISGVLSQNPLPSPPPPPPPMAMPMEVPTPPMATMPMEMPTPMAMSKPHEWTNEENIIFENAIAEVGTTPSFFEKSIEEVKALYESLIHDLEMIVPGMPAATTKGKEKVVQEMRSAFTSFEPKTKKNVKPHDRGVPWTRDEHKCFLMGIHKFGRGDWLNISKYYVISKTPIQVASHAQKYYCRQNSTTRRERRRPSIHDINTVNHTTSSSSSTFPSSLPTFCLRYGVGAYVLDQENPPPFMPENAFNNNNSFIFPSLSNQQ